MKSQAQIIRATVKSPYMKTVVAKKGWSEQVAAKMVAEYLACGKPISLHDYMEAEAAAEPAPLEGVVLPPESPLHQEVRELLESMA